MAMAVSAHNRAIEELVTKHAGRVLKNTGDGVLAMFDDPAAGVGAAIDIQRWLDERAWSSVGHLRVRMGLHSGEPVLLDTGEITGPVINECARLHAAAHGGQVLVSERFAADVADRLPPGCSLRSLGSHTLPDVAPATIHQLCHPELQAEFPPLRSVVGSALDLVGRASTFHGRERELVELEALDAARLVTLVGPGGVGKTRLAQIALSRRGVHHADGVRVVDLSAISRGDDVAEALATSLRLERATSDGRSLSGQVAQWLQTKDIVLLFDNCEHVAGAVADVVSDLFVTATNLRVLCTSRQALGVAGEQVYLVAPLPVETAGQDPRDSPAVQLFVDRASEVRPGYRPDRRQLLAIQRVCRQLDGLPLAIELVAARMVTEDVDEVETVLRTAAAARASGATGIGRHRSLHELVAWSYDMLSSDEQALFARLSIFAGPFSLRAAVDVCGGAERTLPETPALIASLVAKSMVVRTDDAPTLKLLSPVRAVAAELVGAAERAALRRRHVRWYAGWAAEMGQALRGPDEEAASVALGAEFDNLRAAHRFALEDGAEARAATIVAAVLTFAVHRFRFEVVGWAEASLDRRRTPDRRRPTLHGLLGIRAWMRGDLRAAQRHADEGVAIEERHGLAPAIHPRLVRLAVAGYEQRFEDAFNEFDIAYRRARELRDPSWRIEVLIFSAVGMMRQGATELAAQIAERAAALAAELGNPTALAWARYAVAESVYHDAPALAVEYLEEAAELARRVGNEWVLGLVKVATATQHRRLGSPVDAAIALLDCLERWSRAENWSEQWRTVREVAHVCALVERYEDAARFLAASEAAPSVMPVAPVEAAEILRLHARFDDELGSERRQRLQEQARLRSLVSRDLVLAQARDAMLAVVRDVAATARP
jgi:predicted ATPase